MVDRLQGRFGRAASQEDRTSKGVAKEVLDGILGNVARRQHLGIIADSPVSFGEFALKIWWERVKHTLKPRTQERWLGIVEQHLKPAFSGALRAVTKAQGENYIGKRIESGAAPSTINREMTVFKHILSRAVLWEYLSLNPIAGLKPLREPSGRTRFLSVEEIGGLLEACEASKSVYLKPFAIVAMNTGMRRNEILSLGRKSIDWANRLVTLADTKNGETRHVYLNEAAYEALKSLPPRIDGALFPFGSNQVTMLFVRAAKRAKLGDFRLHDLRHTFASYQAMSGVAGRGLQVLLGHKDARMTMRYSHLSDSYLRAAVNGVVLGGMSPKSDGRREVGTYLAPEGDVENVADAK
jgi:integrase